MEWARGFLRRYRLNALSERVFQEQLDTYKLLLVLSHRTLADTEESEEQAIARVEAVPEHAREDEVRNLVHDQVKAILGQLGAELGTRPTQDPTAAAFRLGVRPSSIPGARHGVFLEKGSCRAGQVILFYPGLVIRPHHISRMPGFPRILDPYHMLAIAHGGAVIDPYHVSAPGAPAESLLPDIDEDTGEDPSLELLLQRLGDPLT
ncbi:hypothetical protein T484DRAFT_1831854, partial [Baffinella frigidus]